MRFTQLAQLFRAKYPDGTIQFGVFRPRRTRTYRVQFRAGGKQYTYGYQSHSAMATQLGLVTEPSISEHATRIARELIAHAAAVGPIAAADTVRYTLRDKLPSGAWVKVSPDGEYSVTTEHDPWA